MVDNIITKPIGLVLIIAAHIVFNGPSRAEVPGILGTNITLQFPFNVTITNDSVFSVYITAGLNTKIKKIAQYPPSKHQQADVFYTYPKDNSVFLHITSLEPNNSGSYSATLFMNAKPIPSKVVQLIVREANRSSTVPPMQDNIPKRISEGSGSSSSFHIVTVLVVSPVVLLAAALPWLIWCVVRSRDKQQQPPQESSTATIQETVSSNNVPAPSLVYSVLDFPKRPPAGLAMNPSDTEYAAVSYLPEHRV